jgi:hypothetical protein
LETLTLSIPDVVDHAEWALIPKRVAVVEPAMDVGGGAKVFKFLSKRPQAFSSFQVNAAETRPTLLN